MRALTYRQYKQAGEVNLKYLYLFNVVKELNEGLPCSQWLIVIAPNVVVFMECDEGAALLLVHVAYSSTTTRNDLFHDRPFYQSFLS